MSLLYLFHRIIITHGTETPSEERLILQFCFGKFHRSESSTTFLTSQFNETLLYLKIEFSCRVIDAQKTVSLCHKFAKDLFSGLCTLLQCDDTISCVEKRCDLLIPGSKFSLPQTRVETQRYSTLKKQLVQTSAVEETIIFNILLTSFLSSTTLSSAYLPSWKLQVLPSAPIFGLFLWYASNV